MSEHHAPEAHAPAASGSKEGSLFEKLPIIGTAIKILKTIGSSEGLLKFLEEMDKFIVPISLQTYEFFGHFFGMEGGGGGHAAPAHAH